MDRTHVMMRLFKYCTLGIVPMLTNLSVFATSLSCGIGVGLANMLGFIAGGQASFWVHDRFTFGDRHPTIRGWQRRWVLFMPGNLAGLGVNSVAAATLIQINSGTPQIYVGAMVCSVAFTFTWNNLVSHKQPPPPPSSVESD